jgi:hypothetical protein
MTSRGCAGAHRARNDTSRSGVKPSTGSATIATCVPVTITGRPDRNSAMARSAAMCSALSNQMSLLFVSPTTRRSPWHRHDFSTRPVGMLTIYRGPRKRTGGRPQANAAARRGGGCHHRRKPLADQRPWRVANVIDCNVAWGAVAGRLSLTRVHSLR